MSFYSTESVLNFPGRKAGCNNENPFNFRNGKLYLNPKPGLGVTFDPKKASLIMEITSNTKFPHPILKSPDGAIHNW